MDENELCRMRIPYEEFKDDEDFEEVRECVESYVEFFDYNIGSSESVVEYINRLVLKTHYGFRLLRILIDKLPQEVILPHSQQWLFRIIFEDTLTVDNLEVIGYLLQHCSGTEDLDKFFNTHILKIANKCMVMYDNEDVLAKAPELLCMCIEKYPKLCRGAMDDIHTYLHNWCGFDAPEDVVHNVGKVFCTMHKMSDSPENAWTELFQKLCVTLHMVYDEFFMAGTEYASYKQHSNIEPYRIEISHNNISAILNNTRIFMCRMLSDEIGIQKNVSLQDLLNLIVRGLAVDTYEKREEAVVMYKFTVKLYRFQVGLTYLLRSAIFLYKKKWLSFAANITKIILDCLQRCRKKFFESSSTYQKAVYETLCEWLSVIGNNVEVKDQEIILQNIMLDISSNLLEQDTATTVNSLSENDLLTKEIVCEYALKTASDFVSFVDLEVNTKMLDDFFSLFVRILTMNYSKKKSIFTTSKCSVAIRDLHSRIFTQPYYLKIDFIHRAVDAVNAGIFEWDSTITCNNLWTVMEMPNENEGCSISVINSEDANLSINTNHKANVPDLEVGAESKECEETVHQESVESGIHCFNSEEPPNKKQKVSQDDNEITENTCNSDIKIISNEVNLLNSSHIDEPDLVENKSENSDSDNENCLNSFHNTLHDL